MERARETKPCPLGTSGTCCRLCARWCSIAGHCAKRLRKREPDFEPVLERRIYHFINYAHGVWHIGQRDVNWVRISKDAYQQGFRLRHLGEILYVKLRSEFANIVGRVQVYLYTREDQVLALREVARDYYARRDARLAALRDEAVDTFYSCVLCQTFAPNHVCIVLPERVGFCGSVSWLDARAAYEIDPHGCNQSVPIRRGFGHGGRWVRRLQRVYPRKLSGRQ
jgi:acetyl-CoA synthase